LMLPLTVWMNMPSFHQADLFNDLVSSGEVDLQVVYARKLSSDRIQLGWRQKDEAGKNETLSGFLPLKKIFYLVWSGRKRIHIVNGIWAEPKFMVALFFLLLFGCSFFIYSEAPEKTQYRSLIKLLFQKLFGAFVARRAKGLLAVSHFASDFYEKLGFAQRRIYPFGYFRSGLNDFEKEENQEGREIIFIGQIIHRKGVDILLKAIAPLFDEYENLRLTIIGDGEEKTSLKKIVNEKGISDRVIWEGIVQSEEILSRLAKADILVLPSRWDGWGMVINEAFSVGIPVIVSDQCGAADLVQTGVNGYIFKSEDVEDLRKQLREFLNSRDRWKELKQNAYETSKTISTEAVTPYLIECLKHATGQIEKRPTPPWMK